MKSQPDEPHYEAPIDLAETCAEPGRECVLKGIGVSPGITIGQVFVYARDGYDVTRREIDRAEVEAELQRFETAVKRAERDLVKIITVARERLGENSAAIFEAQRLMLRDSQVYGSVRRLIGEDRCNADYAVKHVMSDHSRRMETSGSEYLRERAHDLVDVQDRLIRHLRRGKLLSAIESETIVVAQNLTAADMVLFSRRQILGCATDFGGPTSHVSIVARAMSVPAVVGLHAVTERVESGDLVILDGAEGTVILNPTPERIEEYRIREERYRRLVQEQQSLVPLPAETLDGEHVSLRANLELEEELGLLERYGAEGIGLFRTEIQFLFKRNLSPSEDDLYEQYRAIAEHVDPDAVTFRMLDLGGDKVLPLGHRESNPFLGWRGIRVLLDRPELMRTQLRAILRASVYGPTRVLLPMVTGADEIADFKTALQKAQDELRAEGLPFDERVPVGMMVEVPAAALRASDFAAEVDFMSIGTNDLTQYVLAVDRGNDLVASLFQDLHPAVLRLIQMTVEAARQHGIPVSVCGEMASDPRATPILVGLGIRELSAVPSALPAVKQVVRALTLDEAEHLAQRALELRDAASVRAMVDEWLGDHGCGLFSFLHEEADEEPSL